MRCERSDRGAKRDLGIGDAAHGEVDTTELAAQRGHVSTIAAGDLFVEMQRGLERLHRVRIVPGARRELAARRQIADRPRVHRSEVRSIGGKHRVVDLGRLVDLVEASERHHLGAAVEVDAVGVAEHAVKLFGALVMVVRGAIFVRLLIRVAEPTLDDRVEPPITAGTDDRRACQGCLALGRGDVTFGADDLDEERADLRGAKISVSFGRGGQPVDQHPLGSRIVLRVQDRSELVARLSDRVQQPRGECFGEHLLRDRSCGLQLAEMA